jgi:hypothetical protein
MGSPRLKSLKTVAVISTLVQQTRIQFGDDCLSVLFVGVQVGRVGPADQEVVGEGLLGHLFAELLKKIVIFEAHDESESQSKYMMVGI